MITDYHWEFSDGVTGDGKQFSRQFLNEGTYEVTLTVTDANGNESVKTKSITITFQIFGDQVTYTGSATFFGAILITPIGPSTARTITIFSGGIPPFDIIWSINGNIVATFSSTYNTMTSTTHTFDFGETPVSVCAFDSEGSNSCINFIMVVGYGQ